MFYTTYLSFTYILPMFSTLTLYSCYYHYYFFKVGLGQLYLQGGRGVPIDIQTAYNYFQRAAENGNALAYGFLGKVIFHKFYLIFIYIY